MFNEQEIISMAKNAASIAKDIEKAKEYKSKYAQRTAPPSYYPLYALAVKNMNDIKVHAEKGVFPYHLFANKSPNETAEEAEYIEKNYKQTTLPVFMDYQSTVGRAFHDANWSISYNADKDNYVTAGKTFQNYVETGIKNYQSVENFVKSIIPSIKAVDAMGVIVVKPHEIPTIESEGGTVIDPDKLFEPVPYYYSSKQIVNYEDDEFYLVETIEKSMVFYNDKPHKIGRVYELYDKDNIFKIKQIGKFIDNDFAVELYFNHNWNRVPVTKLKGVPKYEDGKILWQSPFLYAVDNLDLVAMNSSNLQISINKCVFPYAILLGDECEFQDNDGSSCNGGWLINLAENTKKLCTSCNGSGLKSRMSPMGQMIVKAETRNNETELRSSQKAIEYVSPDTAVLEFLEKNIERNKSAARQILHLKDSNKQAQFNSANETATANNNDLKALYAFVKTVSDQTFDLYQFILDAIGYQRYGKDYQGVTLIYPQAFDFLTEEDYLIQISEAAKAGLPPFVLHTIIYKYLKALFFADKKTADAFNLIIDTDRLLTLSNDDIALKLAKGTAAKWEEVLHTSSINFVNELFMINDKFFEQEFSVQKEQLIELAKKTAGEIAPPATVQSKVNEILNVA